MQGPHHPAQKSTKTVPPSRIVRSKLSMVSATVAIHPPYDGSLGTRPVFAVGDLGCGCRGARGARTPPLPAAGPPRRYRGHVVAFGGVLGSFRRRGPSTDDASGPADAAAAARAR